MTTKITPSQKLKIAREVFDVAYRGTETFREENIGADLAYLLGAIVDTDEWAFVDWRANEYAGCGPCQGRIHSAMCQPALLSILKTELPADHPVWGFIQLDSNAKYPPA